MPKQTNHGPHLCERIGDHWQCVKCGKLFLRMPYANTCPKFMETTDNETITDAAHKAPASTPMDTNEL